MAPASGGDQRRNQTGNPRLSQYRRSAAGNGNEHRENGPRLLTPQLVAGANIVITMGCGDEGCLILPVDSQNWDLPDLERKSIEDFRELRNLITVKCERLLREIES